MSLRSRLLQLLPYLGHVYAKVLTKVAPRVPRVELGGSPDSRLYQVDSHVASDIARVG